LAPWEQQVRARTVTHTCTYMHMHTNTQQNSHTHTQIHTLTSTQAESQTFKHTHVCTWAHAHAYTLTNNISFPPPQSVHSTFSATVTKRSSVCPSWTPPTTLQLQRACGSWWLGSWQVHRHRVRVFCVMLLSATI